MSYNPATDFLGIWRNIAGQVSKVEMPGLDYVLAALARAGLITLSVGAAPPVVNQAVTAWLQVAVPSNSAEGVLRLWDPAAAVYVAATPALFTKMLETAAGQNGASWRATAGGPPINTVGNDGDYAIQVDQPGGIYGPKAAGAWPGVPLPGTTDLISSQQLDATFGTAPGSLIVRGADVWQTLPIGANALFLVSDGFAPGWHDLSTVMDLVIGSSQGALSYRSAAQWTALPPGVAGQVLLTGGPGANPSWAAHATEFPSGTTMLFQQTAAPVGWTKQVAINDYGLRVTSGAVGVVAGSGFSTVFAQTVVGNTTLSTAQIPAHSHTAPGALSTTSAVAAAGHAFADAVAVNTGNTGTGGSHAHSVNLTLSYVDVIIAVKN